MKLTINGSVFGYVDPLARHVGITIALESPMPRGTILTVELKGKSELTRHLRLRGDANDERLSVEISHAYVEDNQGAQVLVNCRVSGNGSRAVQSITYFTLAKAPRLDAPSILEASAETSTINLVKRLEHLTILVPDIVDLVPDDTILVTLSGAETFSIPVQVQSQGPQYVVVPITEAMPDPYGDLVTSYEVWRDGQMLASASQGYAMVADESKGNAGYAAGTASWLRFDFAEPVRFDSDLPTDTILAVSPLIRASAQTSITCPAGSTGTIVNLAGAQPVAEATTFPTSLPGIGVKFLVNDKAWTAGPRPASGTFGNGFDYNNVRYQLVWIKTGEIAAGAIMPRGDLLRWEYGSNHLTYMTITLNNDVVFESM